MTLKLPETIVPSRLTDSCISLRNCGRCGAGDEVFEAGVGGMDRAAGDLGQDGRVDLGQVDTAAVAVARADVARLDDADLVLRDLERLRQAGARRRAPTGWCST